MFSLLFPSTLGAFPLMLIKCFSFYFCHLGQVAAKSIKTRGWKGKAAGKDVPTSLQLTGTEGIVLKRDIDITLEQIVRDPLPLKSSPTLLRLLSHWSLNRNLFGELFSHSGLNLNPFLLPLPKILIFFPFPAPPAVVCFVVLKKKNSFLFSSIAFYLKMWFPGPAANSAVAS